MFFLVFILEAFWAQELSGSPALQNRVQAEALVSDSGKDLCVSKKGESNPSLSFFPLKLFEAYNYASI